MKKRFWFLAAVGILVVALAAPAAFAAITGSGQQVEPQQDQTFSDQMFDWHQGWLDQAQKDGSVSPEQAQAWQEHFSYMREFHAQNGFGPMGSMMNGEGFNGMMGPGGMMGGNGYGGMMGPGGMMGGNGYGGMMGGGYNNSTQTN